MAVGKITKRAVDAMQPGDVDTYLWDTEQKGFGVKCTPTGAKIYLFKYQLGGRAGKTRRITIGRHGDGPITPDFARCKAKEHAGRIAKGEDVGAQVQAEKAATTFADLAREFQAIHVGTKLKQGRSAGEYDRIIDKLLVPRLSGLKVRDICYQDVERFHHSQRETPIQANRAVAILSKMMTWAVRRGDRPDRSNPCVGIERFPEAARARILNHAEIAAFWRATGKLGFPFGPLFRMLIITGQRLNEVAGMPRSELDLSGAMWCIASNRAKNGEQHEVHLSPQAMEALTALPHMGTFVFSPGQRPPSGFSKAKRRLDALMAVEQGGAVTEWRLHDLRRTAASGMAALGVSSTIIEKVLNHVSGVNSGLVAVYQRHEYDEERKAALIAWGARLDAIVEVGERVEEGCR